KPAARGDDDNAPAPSQAAGGGKSKKKALVIDDDEYSIATELSEEASQPQEEPPPIPGKKKGKKGNQKGLQSKQQQQHEEEEEEEEEEDKNNNDDLDDDAPQVSFTGKKKSRGKKGGGPAAVFSSSNFGLLGEDETDDGDKSELLGNADSDPEDEPPVSVKGKQKGGKKASAGVFTAASFDALDAGEDEEDNKDADEDEAVPAITFTGKKKKSSKSTKKSGGSSGGSAFAAATFDGLDDEEESKDEDRDDDDVAAVTFSGKKKKSSKSTKKSGGSVFAAASFDGLDDEEESKDEDRDDDDVAAVTFSGKKKKSSKSTKKGGSKVSAASLEEENDEDVKSGLVGDANDVPERVAGEQPRAVEANEIKGNKSEEVVETSKEKKLPKHVREMQEAIAKRKELEERKAREEEEKRKKEEEERRRQEELERQAEEAKRRKKEREKEKLLKKKQEGKLLTVKQKEEQRRREAMRNQILANAGISIPTADKEGAPTKRPKYQSKKSKPGQQHANGAASVKAEEAMDTKESIQEQKEDMPEVESVDIEKVEEVPFTKIGESQEVATEAGENGMEEEEEDDEDWDAKSWDDVDSEPEPVLKKDMKSTVRTSHGAATSAATKSVNNSVPAKPIRSQEGETKNGQTEVEVTDKNKRKDVAAKSKTVGSDDTSKPGEENLRSPICCIMGHVDTGKTKLLDCIRGTNVQEGEAGGITQQIGATYFPAENIRERTKELKADAKLNVPGLLVIDTPGHESFTNLRSRGSGLCDIAILVVDIMHGLEPQTIESLNLLRMRNTEFIVALNKVDRLYGWKTSRNAPIRKTMKQQSRDVNNEFERRLTEIITQFKEQGLNTELYYRNKDMGETYNIVPTSAVTGEGIPDLLLLLVQWSQKTMVEKLTFRNELQGPIVTTIRALLTPHPMKELRVKGTYLHHKQIKAAQGIKITAQGLEHAIAGTGLYVVKPDDNLEDVMEAAMEDMKSVMSRIDKSGEGVYVQASTLGSLEALLEFLKSPAVSIPVSGIGIGPVHKKDVMKASVMLEKKKEYATILAFDVKVTPEARELADELGVKIFIADIIYHLFDQFKAYIQNLKEEKKKEAADEAVFPCVLEILPDCVFNKKDPIILGVDVLEGILKVGTPICVPSKDFIDIGRIASIEHNKKPVDYAKKGQKVAIKIVGTNPEEQQKMHGRHFETDDELVSHISRRSIDILKANYRDDLSMDEWRLVVKLKSLFKIQ
ncbi:hypothetical protein Tsubulata_014628, partial [Turnera subulata]